MTRIWLRPWTALGAALAACGAPPIDPSPSYDDSPGSAVAPNLGVGADTSGQPATNPSGPPLLLGVEAEAPADPDVLRSDQVCAGVIHEGERLPLDMYFLVDLSGSMAERGPGGTKWDLVSEALISFASEPRNAGIGVGIGYFPLAADPTCVAGEEGCLCIPFVNICLPNLGGSCAVADYAAPAVPLSLPPQPQLVIESIRSQRLAGGTPTRPALQGALQYVDAWASANPGRRAAVVLATDGDPTGCAGNGPQEVADLAARAANGANRIQTFVLGVGRSLTALDLVARAGGTTRAFLTDTSGNLVQELADALAKIRNQAGPCAFEIAGQSLGLSIDPGLVNVRYTPPGGAAPVIVARTSGGSAANCGPEGGWHYDDPAAPTRIQLCEATCAATAGARLEVEFGCETIVAPLR